MSDKGPLAGVKVVEAASWIMAPTSAALLATYGADVIKIEPAGAVDPCRSSARPRGDEVIESAFEISNNNKRGMQLSFANEAGREVMHKLLTWADVFITNIRSASLARLGMDAETVTKKYPQLIFAHATGYGTTGPDRNRAAFDELAYWARGGMSQTLATDEDPPVQLVGAMGDLPSAVAMAAGIMMALWRREHEGQGGIVDVSLYSAGMWCNALAIQGALLGGQANRTRSRLYRINPLYTNYRCADNKWVQFAMYQTDRYWDDVCKVLGRPDMTDEERFSTHELRCTNNVAAIAELQKAMLTKTLAEWTPLFDEADFAWSPVFDVVDIANDEQARVNNYIVPKKYRSGTPIEVVAPPFQIRGEPFHMGAAPEVGQHTESVLIELGYSWEEIENLRERGAF